MNKNNSKPEYVPNERLKKARTECGWTQNDVAEKIKLPDKKQVGRWERGVNAPHPHYRKALVDLFGKSMEELGLLQSSEDKSSLPASPSPAVQPEAVYKLPPFFTSFIGREQDIATVCARLSNPEVRLLTLFGPGGVGKTRLSIEAATAMRSYFTDGVCFVSLGTISGSSFVVPTIAEALNLRESGGQSLEEQIKAALRPKKFLLVLDNFEQVLERALFIEELLAACPYLKVLVTSRITLSLSSQHLFSVPPLPLPDLNQLPPPETLLQYASIALFVQRAQAVQSSFQLTIDNARSVTEICVRLDGLPLAIELAAARIKLFPPRKLLVKLHRRLPLLISDLLDLPLRQRTMENTIQWSYDLLREQEQWFFRQLSTFVAGCTLEAVEAICVDKHDINIFHMLDTLLDNSLLQPVVQNEDEPRYVLLESIREYGFSRLEQQGELEEAQHAHAFYFLNMLERIGPDLKGAQLTTSLSVLEGELENMRAALQWFIEEQATEQALRFCEIFCNFCGLRGYWTEEWRWLTQVLDLPYLPSHIKMRARVLRRAGYLAYRLRNLSAARAWLEESALESRELDDNYNLAGSLNTLGWVLYRQNDLFSATHALEDSVAAARSSDSNWSLANSLESLGRFLYSQGYIDRAYALLQESVQLARILSDKESLVRFLKTLLAIEIARGNPDQAAAHAQESFDLARELGTRPSIALAYDNLTDIAFFRGEYERARQLCEERLAWARDLGDRSTVAIKQLHLAEIALMEKDLLRATTLVQEGLTFFREQGDNPNIANALSILADIKLAQGDLTQATNLYKEALQLDEKVGNKRNIGQRLIGLANVAIKKGHPEQATRLLAVASSCLKPDVDLHKARYIAYKETRTTLEDLLSLAHFQAIWSASVTMTPGQALSIQEQPCP